MVRVKAFPENILSSGNAIFRKGKCFHVFGCISKNFPENIFWCLEKKKEKTNLEKKSSMIDARLGSTARCFASSSPTTAPLIAIQDRDLAGAISIFARSRSTARSHKASIAISRSTAPITIGAVLRKITISDRSRRTRAREIGADWSSEFADDRWTGLELGLLLSRARSLSFSGNTLK